MPNVCEICFFASTGPEINKDLNFLVTEVSSSLDMISKYTVLYCYAVCTNYYIPEMFLKCSSG